MTSPSRTQVMRFSRELEIDVEWFSVQWVDSGDSHVERHFPDSMLFKGWLVREQQYDNDEADALIAQLLRLESPDVVEIP